MPALSIRLHLLLTLSPLTAIAAPTPVIPPAAWRIDPVKGQSALTISDERHRGVSGITWAGATRYYCASDRARAIVPLDLLIDPDSGVIQKGAFSDPVKVSTKNSDFEGVAWDAHRGRLFYSTESPAGILSFTLTGASRPGIALPACYRKPALNKSMESLTWNATAGRFWTSNEETLPIDAAAVDAEGGAVVRLQEFDAAGKPLRQFAWRTAAPTLRIKNTGSGVVDLCLLDDGTLLVMERSISGFQLCCRIYRADFSNIPPLTAAPLKPGTFQSAGKHLLYEESTGLTNYEGITAGPLLTDKTRLLLLIADSGGTPQHFLKPLRLTTPPTPAKPPKTTRKPTKK